MRKSSLCLIWRWIYGRENDENGHFGRPQQQVKQFFFELPGARFGNAVLYSDSALGTLGKQKAEALKGAFKNPS